MTSDQKIKDSVQKLIVHQKESSFLNHLSTVIQGNSMELYGTITDNGFKVWSYSGWTSVWHPIVKGTITKKENKISVEISTVMNPLGRLISLLLLSIWTYALVEMVILQNETTWNFIINRIIVVLVMIALPIIAFGLINRYEYKLEREKIKNMCQQLSSNTAQ